MPGKPTQKFRKRWEGSIFVDQALCRVPPTASQKKIMCGQTIKLCVPVSRIPASAAAVGVRGERRLARLPPSLGSNICGCHGLLVGLLPVDTFNILWRHVSTKFYIEKVLHRWGKKGTQGMKDAQRAKWQNFCSLGAPFSATASLEDEG